MPAPKVMAVVVTEAPLDEVRAAVAAHDFSLSVKPAAGHPVPTAIGCCYEVVLANGSLPRPNVARTLRSELGILWPGTIVYDLALSRESTE